MKHQQHLPRLICSFLYLEQEGRLHIALPKKYIRAQRFSRQKVYEHSSHDRLSLSYISKTIFIYQMNSLVLKETDRYLFPFFLELLILAGKYLRNNNLLSDY